MGNCNHVARFELQDSSVDCGSAKINFEVIGARCLSCGRHLGEEDVEASLKKVYTPEVANRIFEIYVLQRKLSFAMADSKGHGIVLPFGKSNHGR